MVRAIPVGVGALAADVLHAALEFTPLDALAAAMFTARLANLLIFGVIGLIAYRAVGIAVILWLSGVIMSPLVVHVGDVVTHVWATPLHSRRRVRINKRARHSVSGGDQE